MSYNLDSVVSSVTFEYDYACERCDEAMLYDRHEQGEKAKAGETVTFGKGFKNSHYREAAEQSLSIARDDALKKIDKALDDAEHVLTEPPTDDESRYIMSISQRSDMTENEVGAALDRYKGHAAQHAIRAAAKRSDLVTFGGETQTERDIEALLQMRKIVDKSFRLDRICNADTAVRNVDRNQFKAVAAGAKGADFGDVLRIQLRGE